MFWENFILIIVIIKYFKGVIFFESCYSILLCLMFNNEEKERRKYESLS